MKKLLLSIIILSGLKSYGQSDFKYQARVNILPIQNFYYASAHRLGIETTTGKWNFGLDVLTYNAPGYVMKDYYYQDSIYLARNTVDKSIVVAGLALNVIRAVKFRNNNNRFLFGLQGFVGGNVQTDRCYTEIYNPSHATIPGYSGGSEYGWQKNSSSYVEEKHGVKTTLGITPFVRLELAINKRFTFTPEYMMPFIFMNNIGGGTTTDFNQGFNFCLGYKFGKG